ncbi:MAG: hypothetical protein ACI959_000448 [Limisphaerales bacterium]|jgi:hypothetical protein
MTLLLLAAYALVLFGSKYLAAPELLRPDFAYTSPLWKLIFSSQIPSWLSGILAVGLLLIQALIFNQLLYQFKVIAPASTLAALFYVLTGISLGAVFSPALLGMTFILIAFYKLVNSYDRDQADLTLLDAGLWIGVASLFHVSFIFFLIFAWVGVLYLRNPSFRELMVISSGFVTAYALTFTIAYVFGDLFYFSVDHFRLGDSFGPYLELTAIYNKSAAFAMPFILGVIGIVFMQAKLGRSLIQIRKIYYLMLLTLLICLLIIIPIIDPRLTGLVAFALPISFFIAYLVNYSGWKRSWELVHLVWFATIIILHWVSI